MVEGSGLVARYRALKERLKKLYAEYSIAAVVTHSASSSCSRGFVVAMGISMGPGPSSCRRLLCDRATKPIRIVITL
jgi:hypothetical protein